VWVSVIKLAKSNPRVTVQNVKGTTTQQRGKRKQPNKQQQNPRTQSNPNSSVRVQQPNVQTNEKLTKRNESETQYKRSNRTERKPNGANHAQLNGVAMGKSVEPAAGNAREPKGGGNWR